MIPGTKGVSFNVFLCWLLVWSGTLGYHDRKEKLFLARQAQDVLKIMAYNGEYCFFVEIFEIMMNSAFNNGTDRIVRMLFDLCVHELKLKPTAAIIMPKLNSQAAGAG
jgi:hypothetical protein